VALIARKNRATENCSWRGDVVTSQLAVDLTKYDVQRADDGGDVGQHMAAAQEVHRLKVGDGRRADLAFVGLIGAIGEQVHTKLSLRRLDRGMDLACGHPRIARLDQGSTSAAAPAPHRPDAPFSDPVPALTDKGYVVASLDNLVSGARAMPRHDAERFGFAPRASQDRRTS
jgi:hypothetical protein